MRLRQLSGEINRAKAVWIYCFVDPDVEDGGGLFVELTKVSAKRLIEHCRAKGIEELAAYVRKGELYIQEKDGEGAVEIEEEVEEEEEDEEDEGDEGSSLDEIAEMANADAPPGAPQLSADSTTSDLVAWVRAGDPGAEVDGMTDDDLWDLVEELSSVE